MNGKDLISRAFAAISLAGVMFLAGGCSTTTSYGVDREIVQVGKRAEPPEGVVRYCWEEPMVRHVKQNPGLDIDGKWYNPSYIAVREVRQGKWRPCSSADMQREEGGGKEHVN